MEQVARDMTVDTLAEVGIIEAVYTTDILEP
jgi:hypothetical protein